MTNPLSIHPYQKENPQGSTTPQAISSKFSASPAKAKSSKRKENEPHHAFIMHLHASASIASIIMFTCFQNKSRLAQSPTGIPCGGACKPDLYFKKDKKYFYLQIKTPRSITPQSGCLFKNPKKYFPSRAFCLQNTRRSSISLGRSRRKNQIRSDVSRFPRRPSDPMHSEYGRTELQCQCGRTTCQDTKR